MMNGRGRMTINLHKSYVAEHRLKLEQVDGAPSHIHVPAPSQISVHIKISNAFLQSSFIGLSPVKVLRFYLKWSRRNGVTLQTAGRSNNSGLGATSHCKFP